MTLAPINVPAINKHIRNIISENELEESSTISKMEIVRYEGNRSVISKHVKKIFDDYECDEKSNVQKMHIPNSDKLVEFYSLDIIIAVGFQTVYQIL